MRNLIYIYDDSVNKNNKDKINCLIGADTDASAENGKLCHLQVQEMRNRAIRLKWRNPPKTTLNCIAYTVHPYIEHLKYFSPTICASIRIK